MNLATNQTIIDLSNCFAMDRQPKVGQLTEPENSGVDLPLTLEKRG